MRMNMSLDKQYREESFLRQGVVAIYVDDGASVGKVMRSVSRELAPTYIVRAVMAHHLDLPRFFDNVTAFIMPGGADLPYCQKLNGERNVHLRRWVESGGSYIGICAGAYYACAEVKFHLGRADEVAGPRELGLLSAAAVGSLSEIAMPYDLTLRSASVVRLRIANGELSASYYHGGPKFDLQDSALADILARYEDIPDKPAAMVKCNVGKGVAFLSGVHPEVSAADLLMDVLSSDNCENYLGLLIDLQNVEIFRRQLWRELLSAAGLTLADASIGIVEQVPSSFLRP